MIIAFMGNDGSGKTTIARAFREKLSRVGLTVEYREEFDYFILKYFLKLFPTNKLGKMRNKFLKKEKVEKIPIYFKVWPLLVWFDLLLEYIWIKAFKRNRIVIMDRYAYDFLMSWEFLGYNTSFTKYLYLQFPKPDIPVILEVSPQVAYDRKKDTHDQSLDFYHIQRERYLELADKLKIQTINTEKDMECSLNEVINEFRRYFIDRIPNENKVLFLFTYPQFEKKLITDLRLKINWDSLDWEYILDIAAKSNVEYLLANNLIKECTSELPSEIKNRLQRVIEICENQKGKTIKTLRLLSKEFSKEKIDFIVFKTFPPFDYIPTDIDILVKRADLLKAEKLLKTVFQEEIFSMNHNAKTFKENNLVPVDLHYEISWLKVKAVDERVIWTRFRQVKIADLKINLPSIVDELDIVTAHSIFQHHYTTLGESYYMITLLRMLNNDSSLIEKDHAFRWLWSHALFREFLAYDGQKECVNLSEHITQLDIYDMVFFHPLMLVPKNNYYRFVDFLLHCYRKMRYSINGTLPYNMNWMKGYDF